MPLLTGDLFGTTAYHKVLGVMMAMNSLGLCLGAPLGDLYFDIFGTYRPCFWFFGVSMIAVVIGYRFVIRAAYRDKEAFLTETA
jgi:predicted MFS family arabinose efflux permease